MPGGSGPLVPKRHHLVTARSGLATWVVVWLVCPLFGLTLARNLLLTYFPLLGGRRRSWVQRKVMKAWGCSLPRRRALLSTGMLVIQPQSAHHFPHPQAFQAPLPLPRQVNQHKGRWPHHHHHKKAVSCSISSSFSSAYSSPDHPLFPSHHSILTKKPY